MKHKWIWCLKVWCCGNINMLIKKIGNTLANINIVWSSNRPEHEEKSAFVYNR